MRRPPAPLPLVLVGLLAGAGCRSDGAGADAAAEADGFQLVDVADYDALAERLDALGARAVVLNVWATWCGPCIAEFPELIRYDNAMDGEGVEVRFLSVDDPGERDRVLAFLREREWDEASYLAQTGDIVQPLSFAAGGPWDGSIPITFVLDADGIVRASWLGARPYDFVAAQVDRVLAAPPADQAAARR
jgi:thiol-disulfide isomerase/thioredoxin